MKLFCKMVFGFFVIWTAVSGMNTAVLADGIYIPARATRKLPDIPTQRALLVWKDGTETLVISSSLNSESQKLGWIIPLPATPTVMEKADPGGLKTLAFCVQPKITHDLWQEAKWLTIGTGWFFLLVVIGTFAPKRLPFFLVVSFLLLIFSSLLLSAGLGISGASIAGVHAEKTAQVGAYEITVLKARGESEFNAWLATNQFASLPSQAEPMITDYIRRGWVFTAIKLTRSETGTNTPHPIKFVFPSREAVYPWTLTTLASGAPYLELFVVGNQRANIPAMTREFCDRMLNDNTRSDNPNLRAEQARLCIAHPEILPLLWSGCVLTKLSGSLDASRVTNDLTVNWAQHFVPYQQHFYTHTGAKYVAWLVFFCGACVLTLVVLLSLRHRIQEQEALDFQSLKFLATVLLISLTAAGITYLALPKLRNADLNVRRSLRPSRPWLYYTISHILENDPALLKQNEQTTSEAILRQLPAAPHSWRQLAPNINDYQGGPVCVESSPGNFTVEKRDGKTVILVYGQDGHPWIVEP
jgi:hypothetical protein